MFTSVPPLALRALSFLSSITFCKRSVSISLAKGVDGAPILLFDDEISFGRFFICCSAAFISSTETLCVDRRSRRA